MSLRAEIADHSLRSLFLENSPMAQLNGGFVKGKEDFEFNEEGKWLLVNQYLLERKLAD